MATSWFFATDFHGNLHEPEVVRACLAHRWSREWDVVIMGGDLYDFKALREGAGHHEKSDGFIDDVTDGRWFMRQLRPDIWLEGNHDDRIRVEAEKNAKGLIKEYCQEAIKWIEQDCRELGIRNIPYRALNGAYWVESTAFVHGYGCSLAALKKEVAYWGARMLVMGHVHRNESVCEFGRYGEFVGGLMQIEMDYNYRQQNIRNHCNSWACGVSGADTATISKASLVDGEWYMGHEKLDL